MGHDQTAPHHRHRPPLLASRRSGTDSHPTAGRSRRSPVRERRHRLRHLSGRFITSLSRRAPAPEEVAAVRAALNAGEWACWVRLGRADRVEAIATAARLPAEIAADSRWVAAALVHDVGKAECGLGTVGRSVATVRGWVQRPEQIGGPGGRLSAPCRDRRHPVAGRGRPAGAGRLGGGASRRRARGRST